MFQTTNQSWCIMVRICGKEQHGVYGLRFSSSGSLSGGRFDASPFRKHDSYVKLVNITSKTVGFLVIRKF